MDLLLDNARKAATLEGSEDAVQRPPSGSLRSQLPLIYLWHPVNRHGVTANVKGVQTYGDGLIRAYYAEFR